MIIHVPTKVCVLGSEVDCRLSLNISLKDERLVINGYQYTSGETKSIIGFFRQLEVDK